MSSTTRSGAELEFEADDEAGSVDEDNSMHCTAMDEEDCEPENELVLGGGLRLDDSLNVGQHIEIAACNDDDTAEVDSMPDGTISSEAEVFINSASTSLNNLLGYGSECELELEQIDRLDDDFAGEESSSSVSSYNSDRGDGDMHEDAVAPSLALKDGAKSKRRRNTVDEALKALGELSIDELPPVLNPQVAVNSEECDLIGTVGSTLGKLVLVETIPNKPAYDIDTLLFLDSGKRPLGYIFDVMGPVHHPLYAIRFNSEEEISALNLSVGMNVYSAPQTEHSHYVFVQRLMKEKGSDASWKNDLEVPEDLLDFSDDENELDIVGGGLNRKRNSLERHQQFEENMNMRNVIDSRMHKVREHAPPKMRRPNRARRHRSGHPGGGGRSQAAAPRPSPAAAAYGGVPAWGAPTAHHFAHIPPPPPPRPAFHAPAAAGSQCAYHQSAYNLAPYSMPPLLAPVPMYMPHVSPMQFTVPPPPPGVVFTGMPGAAPSAIAQAGGKTAQQPAAAMMYPPDMGLPPVQPNPSLVPNMQYFGPPVMWHNYAATQGPPLPQPVGAAGGNPNDVRTRNLFNKVRRK